MWTLQSSQTAKTIWKKKNKGGELILLNFKLLQIYSNKDIFLGMGIKVKHIDQWNKIESPEKKSLT